jgi:Holliday junction DNA helicase RuvA
MISYLQGQVKRITERSLTVLTGGVGYEVFTAKDTLTQVKIGEEVELLVYTAVREDAIDLYGFKDDSQFYFFKLLITISGIGPKSALNILDSAGPEDIRQAVINDDPGMLQKVNGIGKKTAERIVVELKSKIGAGLVAGSSQHASSEVIEALESLGYKAVEIREVLKQIDQTLTTEQKVSQILKLLGK